MLQSELINRTVVIAFVGSCRADFYRVLNVRAILTRNGIFHPAFALAVRRLHKIKYFDKAPIANSKSGDKKRRKLNCSLHLKDGF